MVGALGYVYGDLFKASLNDYVPFLASGFIAWNLISNLIIEGCSVFIAATGYIRQLRLPSSLYVFRLAWRSLIIFFHNALVFVVVAILFKVEPSWRLLWLLPGLAVILYTGVWLALVLGALCARFRDIPQLVSSLVQVVFFMTPIMWKPELLTGRPMFVKENPFYHFVELIRAPLLGHDIQAHTWLMTLGCALFGSLASFLLFVRLRRRIAFWV